MHQFWLILFLISLSLERDVIMAKRRVRAKGYGGSTFDRGSMQRDADDSISEYQRIHELGEQFEADKAKLEDCMERIDQSAISDEDKKKMKQELELALELKKAEYDKQVTQVEKEIEKEMIGLSDHIQEAAKEAQSQADSLKRATMSLDQTGNTSKAADAAMAQKEAYEKTREEALQKLDLQMQQAAIQRRNMLAKRLRGR